MSTTNSVSAASIIPAGRWSLDASRSSVAFTVKHMMLTTVRGSFNDFEGTLEAGADGLRATGAVKAASIDTHETVRDEHLRRSPDFFDVERYPVIGFNSTRIDYVNGRQLRIVGDLTMRGVTREIVLEAELTGTRGEERIELEVHGSLNRRDFGISWNQTLDTGRALLGEQVKVSLEISAVRRDAGEPQR